MSIEGRIAVDVGFADLATSGGVQSLKKISLSDTQAYTSGKVAIVTGTLGTSQQSLEVLVDEYRDASGETVSFSTIDRIALQSSGPEARYLISAVPEIIAVVSKGRVAVGDIPSVFAALSNHRLRTTAGTASYTLVLYGT